MKEINKDIFFDFSVEPMCIASLDGYFLKVNEAFVKVLGYSKEELLSQPFTEWVHPDDLASTLRAVEKLEEGKITLNFTNRYRTKKGDYLWLSWTSRMNQRQHIYATARDVTEQLKMQENLEQAQLQMEKANNDLESFSYSVSHDLRTPLRAIAGFSEILREDYSEQLDDEGLRLLEVVIDNTQKMGELIDDLLSFSRISRVELIKTPVQMEELFKDTFKTVIDGYPELKRKLNFNVQDLPDARGDMSLLKQVAVNLVSNAIKYSSRNERINIEVGYLGDDGVPTYYVRDNGVGFDMQYADKLFAVFQRLHSSTEYEGTGVGLSLVKRIIDRHGGSIWVESEPGEGTTFFFKLYSTNNKIT